MKKIGTGHNASPELEVEEYKASASGQDSKSEEGKSNTPPGQEGKGKKDRRRGESVKAERGGEENEQEGEQEGSQVNNTNI